MFKLWKQVADEQATSPSPGEKRRNENKRRHEDSGEDALSAGLTRIASAVDGASSSVDELSRSSKRRKTARTSTCSATANEISGDSQQLSLADNESELRTGLPMEVVVLYERQGPIATEATLSIELKEVDTEQAIPPRAFKVASYVFSELGSCAAVLYWRHWIESNPDAVTQQSAIRATVEGWKSSKPHITASSPSLNVSTKFLKLTEVLKDCEPYGETFCGLIVVRRRAVAQTIVRLLQNLQDHLPFIRPAALTGARSHPKDDLMCSFGKGTYNLLVITKSNEDLDIPKASMVIYFDLFDSQISFAYSCARTMGHESHLVHMVEQNNNRHKRILSAVTTLDVKMRTWVEKVAHDPGSAIAPETLHEALDPYCSDSDEESELADVIQDPTTSGLLRTQDATSVIYRMLATPGAAQDSKQQLFRFDKHRSNEHTSFICTVHFPERYPLSLTSGPLRASKAEARRAACFEACRRLFDMSILDCRFFPQRHCWMKVAPIATDRQGEEAVKASGAHLYSRRRSSFWSNSLSVMQESLYPIIVLPQPLRQLHHAPLLILTRLPLPELSDFSVFNSGVKATIRLVQGAPMHVAQDQLRILHAYTLRICRALLNKPLDLSLDNMPYFVAPLNETWRDPGYVQYPSVGEHIPWDLVKQAANHFMVPVLSDGYPAEDIEKHLEDAIIQDRWIEFTNRFFVARVRHDLTPLSKAHDNPRGSEYANFVEYLKEHRKGFEGLKDYNQPIIEVIPVPFVSNYLTPIAKPVTSASKSPAKYLIPELCVKSTIPASTFRAALLLPSITRRIEDLLLVKELNATFFENTISDQHLRAALCAPSTCAEYDYERLELLGDSFLKHVSSIYCYVTMPSGKEGVFHAARQQIVSNKALLSGALRIGLPPYIQSKPFAVKLWQPWLTETDGGSMASAMRGKGKESAIQTGETVDKGQVSGVPAPTKRGKRRKQREDLNVQWLGDKTVADVVEAVIGAAYLTAGQELALRVTKALTAAIAEFDQWSDFAQQTNASPALVVLSLSANTQASVEATLGCKFRKPHLLAQALTHSSVNGSTSYERLEFLGDAILDFFVVRYIFHRYPHLSPGGLTLVKVAMVSNYALAAFCVSSDLHKYLRHTSPDLKSAITAYVNKLNTSREQEYKLSKREHRDLGQYWLDVDPPKVLSDIVESVIGALYVSDDFSEAGVQNVFEHVLRPFYDQHIRLQTLSHHPNKTLFELLHAAGCQQHRIAKTVEDESLRYDVVVHEVILASATSATAASAMRLVSLSAIDALEGDPDFMARTCDCRSSQTSTKGQKDRRAELGYEDINEN